MNTTLTPRVAVMHDGKPVAIVDTENEADARLLDPTYSIATATPWPDHADPDDDATRYKNAATLRRTAQQLVYGDEYHRTGGCRRDGVLGRENCSTCVLHGYQPRDQRDEWNVRRDGPNYAGWARVYVQAQQVIPAKWRQAFELQRRSDNLSYAWALERDIATWGVSFSDDKERQW